MGFWIGFSEVLRNLALAIAAVIGAVLAWQRLRPETTQAELARRAHVADLFNRSVEHLGSDRLEIRLGAIYVLGQVSRDFPDLAYPVYEIVQSYLRQQPHTDKAAPEDVQAAVNLLGEMRKRP